MKIEVGLEKDKSEARPATCGMICSTDFPTNAREVIADKSATGCRRSNFTSSLPVYPDAPITHAFI